MIINESQYLKEIELLPANQDSDLELIKNINDIRSFEQDNPDIALGIIPNMPFYDIILPLYRNTKTGRVFRFPFYRYPTDKPGAATLIVIKEKSQNIYVLEKHFRDFHGRFFTEIPRGYAIETSPILTAIREIQEETGIEAVSSSMISLGSIVPDSGISNNQVHLFALELKFEELPTFHLNDPEEQIASYYFFSDKVMRQKIQNDEITDSFSIAAYFKYVLLCQSKQ